MPINVYKQNKSHIIFVNFNVFSDLRPHFYVCRQFFFEFFSLRMFFILFFLINILLF